MIRSAIFIDENTDISKYITIRIFLKRKNNGYEPKKSSLSTKEEISYFLMEKSDENGGHLRRCRFMSHSRVVLTLESVKQDNSDNIIIVIIPDSKNGMLCTFTTRPGCVSKNCDYVHKFLQL